MRFQQSQECLDKFPVWTGAVGGRIKKLGRQTTLMQSYGVGQNVCGANKFNEKLLNH